MAILAVLVTFETARRQIRATTVSVFRQQRIDAIRNDLAEMLAHAARAIMFFPGSDYSANVNAIQTVGVLKNRLNMLLDPANNDEARLLSAIEKVRVLLLEKLRSKKEPDCKELDQAYDDLFASARIVLRAEARRIAGGH